MRRHGDWERWLEFFAEGIEVSATQALATANTLLTMVSRDHPRIATLGRIVSHHSAMNVIAFDLRAYIGTAFGPYTATFTEYTPGLVRCQETTWLFVSPARKF